MSDEEPVSTPKGRASKGSHKKKKKKKVRAQPVEQHVVEAIVEAEDTESGEEVAKDNKDPVQQESGLCLTSLPLELLSIIFGFVTTDRLYPNCFVINSTCLAAVIDDGIWKQRCLRDLKIDKQVEDLSWRETYRDCIIIWDKDHATQVEAVRDRLKLQPVGRTYAVSKNIVMGKNFIIDKNVVSWSGRSEYVSVRANIGFSQGKHTVYFDILSTGEQDLGVGFAGENWDCRMHAYTDSQRENYIYWKQGGLYEVSGLQQPFGPKRFSDWAEGAVIAVTVDFDEQKVTFELDGEYQGDLPINKRFDKLWPVATLYDGGPQSVRIRRGFSSDWRGVERMKRKKKGGAKVRTLREKEEPVASPNGGRKVKAKSYLQKLSAKIKPRKD